MTKRKEKKRKRGRSMKKETIYKACHKLIADAQYNVPKDAKTDELRYLMAYNDGVLDFCNELFAEIDKENAEKNNLIREKCEFDH